MRMISLIALILAASLTLAGQSHPKDVKGSPDHPLFPNRMPGYSLSNYQQLGFSSYQFRTKPPTAIEGKYTRIHYYLLDPKAHPGGLAIRRKYENAIKAIGGQVVYGDSSGSVLKAIHSGVETWAEVLATDNYSGRCYMLHIVEKQAMQQVITADAIDKAGFIALDIHFATAKAGILPESRPIVDEIAAMLKKRPALVVGVEGHTDNTGTPAGNLTLSKARAQSVAAALTVPGIAANRLIPAGFGQDKPIADNRTEKGRAQNRRVEIVKKR